MKWMKKEYLYFFIISVSVAFVIILSYLAYLIIIYPQKVSEEEAQSLPETGEGEIYRAFVSSTLYNGSLGGVTGADNKCNQLAQNADLCGEYRAWISSSSIDARDRIRNVAYYSVERQLGYPTLKICDNLSDLTDGNIDNRLWTDETGLDKALPPQGEDGNWIYVWTGTSSNGTKDGTVASDFCSNWTTESSLTGTAGDSTLTSSSWTDSGADDCSELHSIYCFEYLKDGDCDGYYIDDDCDDTNDTVYPGASEICDGLDNDCDGNLPQDERDDDQDGYLVCSPVYGDCDPNDPEIYPGAPERCNQIDDNCDGSVPNNEYDRDGDSYRGCEGDCNDSDASINPEGREICDNIDNDCDDKVDDNLKRVCGTNVGVCTKGYSTCVNGVWGECDGVSASTEKCDGLDNDCDGQIDEGCSCSSGATQPCGSSIGSCRLGTQWCEGNVWGECKGDIGPTTEICDGLDNDCDALTDENLSRSCGLSIGECEEGVQYCKNGSWGSCKGGTGKKDEKCDGLDNDCDGSIDDGCQCQIGSERECGVDIGECQKGVQKCEDGKWSECEDSILPEDEVCDGKDNNCNGEVDEGLSCDLGEEEEVEKESEEVTKEGFPILIAAGIVLSVIIALISFGLLIFLLRKRRKKSRKSFKGWDASKKKKDVSEKSPLA